MMAERTTISGTPATMAQFRALGGSRWLNGVLEASMQGARVVLLTDAERVRVVAAVNAAQMPQAEKDAILRKLLG
jgi:hypothetical protein